MIIWPHNEIGEWTWACGSPIWLKPRRTIYFICRHLGNGLREDLEDKRGRLRTWKSREAVIAALERLTGKKARVVDG